MDAAARPWPIGKSYAAAPEFALAADGERYAAATGDDSPAYAGADPILPPMLHVRLLHGLLFQVASDPELGLDMLRLVHGEHDATFHRPLRPWDLVTRRARLESVVEKASGLVVTSRLLAYVEGRLAVEARTVYFIRAPEPAAAAAAAPKVVAPLAEPPPPAWEAPLTIEANQSVRYAEASRDINPIHLDPEVARAAGLPGTILQGLCTMAMTGVAAVRHAANNDARRLRRLAVRFARPVPNGCTLTTRGWATTPGAFAVETRDAQGRLVISHGVAEFSHR